MMKNKTLSDNDHRNEISALNLAAGLLVAGCIIFYCMHMSYRPEMVIDRSVINMVNDQSGPNPDIEKIFIERNRIDINEATADDLESIPGIGSYTAAAIVEHRDTNGGINCYDDLLKVNGIGIRKLEKIKQFIR